MLEAILARAILRRESWTVFFLVDPNLECDGDHGSGFE
jgi:hypothetical protein